MQIHGYNAEDAFSLLDITPDHIGEIWKKSALEVAEELELSLRRGP